MRGVPRRPTVAQRRKSMGEESKAPGGPPPPMRTLDQGKRQFIITPRRGSRALSVGLRPMSTGAVRAMLGQLPGVELMRVLRPRRSLSALSLGPDEAGETYVVRVDADRTELIRHMVPPHLVLEEDGAIEYGTPAGLSRPAPTRLASWSLGGSFENRQIRLRVIGEGEKPLANVGLSLAGEGFPQEGRTDKRGEVTLPLATLPGRRPRSLFVSAPNGYWDQFFTEPELVDGDMNVIRLRAIEETIAGFPEHFRYGWGQLQMGLHRIPETLTCRGVKIAIVDSGTDTSHPLLRHIRLGLDLTGPADPQAWTLDVIGHGTHAAGIIAACDESGKMLRGFAPDAEIHVIKVFPGGQFSSLVEALDYCIDFDIDIVNLSLGCPQPSEAIEQKLEEVLLHGIACVVAAGNSGGRVQYPASSPYTLAIGAVGRLNEFPEATWDATTVLPNLVASDGTFSPAFSAFGPEVAVCAPGVAIVSTVPGGFEPQSGTSTAAPHVTGLAALLLAHHPLFQGPLRSKSQQRVAALFNMIRSLCVPYGFGAERVGAGLPRLYGIEQFLQPEPSQGGSTTGSRGNGQATASAIAASPSTAYRTMAGIADPMPGTVASVLGIPGLEVGSGQVNPLYAPPLVTQAWPVQALLESLRRQYLGV